MGRLSLWVAAAGNTVCATYLLESTNTLTPFQRTSSSLCAGCAVTAGGRPCPCWPGDSLTREWAVQADELRSLLERAQEKAMLDEEERAKKEREVVSPPPLPSFP